jgi:hypothetical protein
MEMVTEARDTPNRIAAFLRSVERNLVALISLTIALAGFGYNTWRNETTERHRNVRQAAFVVLEQLGELQQVVDRRFYGGQDDDLNRIAGWGKVSLVRDMAMLVSASASRQSSRLFGAWQMRLDALDAGDVSAEREISAAIASTREQILRDLAALE